MQGLQDVGLQLALYYFYCILLVKETHRVSPDSRGDKKESPFGYKKLQSHMAKVWIQGRVKYCIYVL